MTFTDQVIAVHESLDVADVRHAFGGALALAFIIDPRATADVDVNVFLPADQVQGVVSELGKLGFDRERAASEVNPIAGIRLTGSGDQFPIDLFPSLDEGYDEMVGRIMEHPFGPDRRLLPFLSAEDLVVFKLSFNRDKDWVDLRQIAVARPTLDVEYVERKVVELRGPTMYPRVVRLRSLLRG
jgi:hypothetical protein